MLRKIVSVSEKNPVEVGDGKVRIKDGKDCIVIAVGKDFITGKTAC